MLYLYKFDIDLDRDHSYGNALADITKYVQSAEWRFGLTSPYEHVATPSRGEIVLSNNGGEFTLGNSNSPYYGLINKGTLIRLRATYDGTTEVLFVLSIESIRPTPINQANPKVTIELSDIMTRQMRETYNPKLLTNARIDEALQDVFESAAVIYPYDGAFFYIGFDEIGGAKNIYDGSITNFEQSYTSLDFVGDNQDAGQGGQIQGYVRDLVAAEFNGLLYFDPRTEQVTFLNRYHHTFVTQSPLVLRTSSTFLTMRDDITEVDLQYAENLTNKYELTYTPRIVGAANAIIYSLDNTPFALEGNVPKEITMRYRDPDNKADKVGAKNVQPIMAGSDLIVNAIEDGTGVDVSSQIAVSLDVGGDATICTLTWNQPSTVYIQTLQLRGTPLYHYDKQTSIAENDTSIYNNGKYTQRDINRSISDEETAQNYVNWFINALSTPMQTPRSISMIVKRAETALAYLQRTIGDLITLMDEQFVETNYMIVGEDHRVLLERGQHIIKWIIRPKSIGNAFIIDVSEIGGTDLILV